jgi:hypothetical protein
VPTQFPIRRLSHGSHDAFSVSFFRIRARPSRFFCASPLVGDRLSRRAIGSQKSACIEREPRDLGPPEAVVDHPGSVAFDLRMPSRSRCGCRGTERATHFSEARKVPPSPTPQLPTAVALRTAADGMHAAPSHCGPQACASCPRRKSHAAARMAALGSRPSWSICRAHSALPNRSQATSPTFQIYDA